jgi:hypothetical protein
VVSAEQWPRALLRAELREAGYDAIGATTLSRALRHLPDDPGRGRVRLIVVDARAAAAERGALALVQRDSPRVQLVLVAGTGPLSPARGPWAATLRRPVSIGDIVATVRRLVPLPAGRR